MRMKNAQGCIVVNRIRDLLICSGSCPVHGLSLFKTLILLLLLFFLCGCCIITAHSRLLYVKCAVYVHIYKCKHAAYINFHSDIERNTSECVIGK